jgi:hypothetical protein
MSSSNPKRRKPVRLSKSLHRDLTNYALAAGATGASVLALAQPSKAEIIYTKVHHVIGRGESYGIDLNQDGVMDFSIHNISQRCTRTITYCPYFRVEASPALGSGIQFGVHTWYAAALLPGAEIGPSSPMRGAPEIMAAQFRIFGSYYYFGSFLNAANRFLGLALKINGETHFGWARFTVQSNKKFRLVAALSDFAYETEPEKPIAAGAGDGEAYSLASETVSTPKQGGMGINLGALALRTLARSASPNPK